MTTRARRERARLRPLLVAVGAGLVAAALAVARLPSGPVGNPDWTVAIAAMTVFRWAGITLATYVAAVASVGLIASLHPGRLLRMTVAATPMVLRRVVFGSSLALAVTGPMGSLAAGASPSGRPPPTMVLLEQPATDDSDPPAATSEPSPAADATWTVRPGDHFWSITAAVLRDELGRAPSEREITGRWLGLIEANRSRLVQPGDPDLLLPGQVLLIPPLSEIHLRREF